MDPDEGYWTGRLKRTPVGRWSIGDDFEITSGCVIEVKIDRHWIRTCIEHNGRDYYATVSSIRLHAGLEARLER